MGLAVQRYGHKLILHTYFDKANSPYCMCRVYTATVTHTHTQSYYSHHHSAQASLIKAIKKGHMTYQAPLTQCFHLLSSVLYSVFSSKSTGHVFLLSTKKLIIFSQRLHLTSDPELTISSEIWRSLHSHLNLFCQRPSELYTKTSLTRGYVFLGH